MFVLKLTKDANIRSNELLEVKFDHYYMSRFIRRYKLPCSAFILQGSIRTFKDRLLVDCLFFFFFFFTTLPPRRVISVL